MSLQRLQELAAKVDDRLSEFEVDLGHTVEPYVPMVPERERPKKRVEYPTLWVNGRKDRGIFDLPKKGKAVINYRVKSRSVRDDNSDGKERFSTDIEIRSIDPIKPKKATRGNVELSARERLQELSSRVDEQLQEFDGRARDDAGRYAQGDAPPSPGDMATVYKAGAKKKKRKIAAILGATGAVAAGAALPGSRKAAARLGQGALRTIRGAAG